MSQILYKAFSKSGTLLYIGITTDTKRRIKEHKNSKSEWTDYVEYWETEEYETRLDVENAEKKSIKEEKPLFNFTHTNGRKPKKTNQNDEFVGIRISKELKEQIEVMAEEYELTTSGFIKFALKKMIREAQ